MAARATRSPKRAAGSTPSRRRVEPALAYRSVRTGAAYEALVKRLYAGVREKNSISRGKRNCSCQHSRSSGSVRAGP